MLWICSENNRTEVELTRYETNRQRTAVLRNRTQKIGDGKERNPLETETEMTRSELTMNTNPPNPIPLTPELIEALDIILDELPFIKSFPDHCQKNIRLVCEAIKSGRPLPFKKGE